MYHTRLLDRLVVKALKKKGFAIVEVVSQCPIYWRWMGLDSPAKMMKWQKDNSIPVEKARELGEAELKGKIVTGVLVDRERPTYHEE